MEARIVQTDALCCWPLDFPCQVALRHQFGYLAAAALVALALLILGIYLCLNHYLPTKSTIDQTKGHTTTLTPDNLATLLSKVRNVAEFPTSSSAPASTPSSE